MQESRSFITTLNQGKRHIFVLCAITDFLKDCDKNIKHENRIKKEGTQDISPFLITNKNGYKFGPTDYKIMDKADSHKLFTQRAVESCEGKSQLPIEVQQCLRNGYFDF